MAEIKADIAVAHKVETLPAIPSCDFRAGDFVQVRLGGHALHMKFVDVIGVVPKLVLGQGENARDIGPLVSVKALGGDLHGEIFGLMPGMLRQVKCTPADVALYRRRIARAMADAGLTEAGLAAERKMRQAQALLDLNASLAEQRHG